MSRILLTLMLIPIWETARSQCNIINRVAADKTMQYYMEPVTFYQSARMSLKGCIVTDKENYFLELYPQPFPEKPGGNKLKGDALVRLADNNLYKLKNFDSHYIDNDSTLQLLYLIGKNDMEPFRHYEVIEVKIDMKGEEGVRTYTFKLHKRALMDQLSCFLKDEKEKGKAGE